MKKPGQDNVPVMSEMDLTYKERYTGAYIPEAYERLILDAIRGDQQHFVRRCAAATVYCKSFIYSPSCSITLLTVMQTPDIVHMCPNRNMYLIGWNAACPAAHHEL